MVCVLTFRVVRCCADRGSPQDGVAGVPESARVAFEEVSPPGEQLSLVRGRREFAGAWPAALLLPRPVVAVPRRVRGCRPEAGPWLPSRGGTVLKLPPRS
jgi:hypothetical protein